VARAAGPLAQFTFTSIDYPGSTLTAARGINNHGVIVGAYQITPPRHAFRWHQGHFLPLAPDTVLGTNFSAATKSNDRGQVVGTYNDNDGIPHGFLLDKEGKLITLDFPTASDTVCYGINESGTVVGYWDLLDANGNFVATNGFVWKDGDFSELRYPNGSFTIAAGVNASGTVVGTWTNDINFIVSRVRVVEGGVHQLRRASCRGSFDRRIRHQRTWAYCWILSRC
jgi:uncharacterized membrane protein